MLILFPVAESKRWIGSHNQMTPQPCMFGVPLSGSMEKQLGQQTNQVNVT